MIAKLRHAGIVVKDLKKAEKFYNRLGFSRLRAIQLETWNRKKLKILKLSDGDDIIELIQGDWRPHLAFTLTYGDMDKMKDACFYKREKNGLKIYYLEDPSGNYVEVVDG